MATTPVVPVPQEDDDPAGMSQYPAWMQEAASPYVDPINALRAAAMRQSSAYPDTPGSTTVHTPTDDLTLGMIASSPEQQRDLQSQEQTQHELDDLTINQPDDRQYNEIMAEAKAKNAADQAYGGQEATRALQRAVEAITAKGGAEQALADSPTARNILSFKTDEGIRAAAPRLENTLDVAGLKAQVEAAHNQDLYNLGIGKLSNEQYIANEKARAGMLSSPIGASRVGLLDTSPGPTMPPATPTSPLAGLRTAASVATGGTGRTLSTAQQGLVARYLQKFPQESQADAIAFYDRTKPQGWQ